MICGFIGPQRNGKTLTMSTFCYDYYLQGFVIVANYTLNFPHEKFTEEMLKNGNYLEKIKAKYNTNKIILAIDEAHLWLSAHQAKKDSAKSYLITQAGKLMEEEGHFFYATQFYFQVNRTLRFNTFMLFHVQKEVFEEFPDDVIYKITVMVDKITSMDEVRSVYIPQTMMGIGLYKRFEMLKASESY